MNQREIKWLPLRLNLIPIINKQAKTILQLYLETRKEIIEGDILAIHKLTTIKQQIKQRLKDIRSFYIKNAMDPRTKYLYSTESILSKIADQQNSFEKMNETYGNDRNWLNDEKNHRPGNLENFAISSNTTQRKQTPPNSKIFRSSFQNETQRNANLHFQNKQSGQLRLSDLQRERNERRSPINLAGKSPINKRQEQGKRTQKGSSRKIEQGLSKKGANKKLQQVIKLERQKNEMGERLERSPYEIKKSFKDLSELVFTIKMTKQEYNEFMRLKRKNNHA